MFLNTFFIVFIFLYFWYMTSFPTISKLSKPTHSALDPNPPRLTYHINSHGGQFQFLINTQIAWKDTLPDSFQITNNQFMTRNVCHQKPDGTLVPAVGQTLYEHVQQDLLMSRTFTFEPDASLMLQNKNIFYFSCQRGNIYQLHMCPPGQFFKTSTCHIINQCSGQKDGKTFPDPYDLQRFIECHNETTTSKTCPPNTYFAYDKCYDPMLIGLYCYAVTEPKILDFKTLVVCREGKIMYEICPPGFRYFDTPICEPEACIGYPDGHRVPLPKQRTGPLWYSPGYMECANNKVKLTQKCPQVWDYHHSFGDNLTHLPQVFDGRKCTIPEFCVNVTPDDPNVIVPVHEFTKHVRNWVYSELFDRVTGFQCQGSTRKRVALDPGEIIHPKRLKRESACDGKTEHVPVSIRRNEYFDCTTNTLETCPVNQFFDGHECRPHIPHGYTYQGFQLFQMDSLREDNWMIPWDYSKLHSAEPCQAPETEYLETYNICSHPDCKLYPWLSQIPFQVALRDGTLCLFDEQTRHIHKEDTEDKYLYWAQRQVEEIDPQESCIPGQNIQSGHFVFDKTIFATCDDKQPFVFCPSSSTNGIALIDGQRWACVPPNMKGVIPSGTTVLFQKFEVKQLLPLSNRVTEVLINNRKNIVPPIGLVETNKFTLETLDEPVEVEYNYRITHPPDVSFPEKVSKFIGAFLIKAKDFTRKPVEIPVYRIKDSVTAFLLT